MSRNRNTKTYWRRVTRLAKKLAFSAAYEDQPIEPYNYARRFDPKAIDCMVEDAAREAVRKSHALAGTSAREVVRHRSSACRLEKLQDQQTRRARLQAIRGGAA